MDLVTVGIATALASRVFDAAVEKGTEAALDEVGSAGKRLVEWLRERFAHRKELAALEQAPDGPRRVQAFSDVVQAELLDDDVAAAELQNLVDALEAAEPKVFQQAEGMANVLVSGSYNVVNNTYVNTLAQPRVGVRWQLRQGKGATYALENVGDETAFSPRVAAAGAVRLDCALNEGEADMPPGSAVKIFLGDSLQSTADFLGVTWHEGSRDGFSRQESLPLF